MALICDVLHESRSLYNLHCTRNSQWAIDEPGFRLPIQCRIKFEPDAALNRGKRIAWGHWFVADASPVPDSPKTEAGAWVLGQVTPVSYARSSITNPQETITCATRLPDAEPPFRPERISAHGLAL
jgi:hypothetical protein